MTEKQPAKQKPDKVSESNPALSPNAASDSENTWGKEKESATEITPAVPSPRPGQGQSNPGRAAEETTWAVIAHLSVLLNLVTGFLGGIAAIVIYFIYKDRSRFVAYHAMQSFIFQSIAWLGGGLISGLLIAFGGAFSFLILPLLCLVPGILILLLIPISLIYGVIGAVQVSNTGDFRYWLVGGWVRNILEPNQK